MADAALGMSVVQRHPAPEPQATIDTRNQSRRAQVGQFTGGSSRDDGKTDAEAALDKLQSFTAAKGDISDLLDPGQVESIGADAIREWRMDQSSREDWLEVAQHGLALAAQEQEEGNPKDYPWDDASDIHYPIITTATQQFAARAYPELVKGDKVVGVKVFNPPAKKPAPGEIAKSAPPPTDPQMAQQGQAEVQQDQQAEAMADLAYKAKMARAERVKHYLNWTIFYKMPNWEGETDALLHEMPVVGAGFKKVYMAPEGLRSDAVSALRLTVHQSTKSLDRCPRITQDFDAYPYEIEQAQRAGRYRADVTLDHVGIDPENPRLLIEQHRMEDLDGDGLVEPYIVTVDVDTQQVLRIEPAFDDDDVVLDGVTGKVIRIDRWQPFPEYMFLPDPKGRYYGIGFARLLDSITDSVDTSINQLIDAGNAQIAGGGFIGSNVRLQGSGQGGSIWFRPGEYQTVSTAGPDLKQAIWERTVPSPSTVTFQMLELLLNAAKDIASVKDVITGDAPSNAPVGTTLALQNQALQVFSAIFKRIYRGFHAEFRLMFKCLKRWAGDRERQEYTELTGGDFDEDFAGDGTDIQPVADPSVVTKMQKISRIQSVLQFAESPVGMAAGMQMPGPAQALALDFLDILDWDRPDRLVADVPPNPEVIAKAKDTEASANLKGAQAQEIGSRIAKTGAEIQKIGTAANKDRAETVEALGRAHVAHHELHQEADRVAQDGMQPPEEEAASAA